MNKMNCWEYVRCGCQPGGEKTEELGVCPAAVNTQAQGINDGINGGRSCWVVVGTLCRGKIQDDFTGKLGDCLQCGFYALVREEQGDDYINTIKILKRMNGTNNVAQSLRLPGNTIKNQRRTP